jgi:hypothetical protein
MTKFEEQAIRDRAYALWEQEGHPNGKDIDHWLRAEAEMKLTRVNELRGLVRNPASRDAYFQNFDQTVNEWPPKRRQFLDLEHELQGLDRQAWAYLKEDVAPLIQTREPIRGWQALFNKLNHAKAYNHLARLGCSCIAFIPESQVTGQRTPDLKATLSGTEILCEVKTINTSEIEAHRRVEGGVGTTDPDVSKGFLRKLIHDVQNAKEQMDMYSGNRPARKIVYVIVNFDDALHEYAEMYKRQIDEFLTTEAFSDLEIEFNITPPFYTAMG